MIKKTHIIVPNSNNKEGFIRAITEGKANTLLAFSHLL